MTTDTTPARLVLPHRLDWNAIRDRLAGIMKDRGLTQSGLADGAGINQATLSRFLSGKFRELDMETLDAIATALDIPIGDLAGIAPGPSDEPSPLRMIPLNRIAPSRFNPRVNFPAGEIHGLALSIGRNGIEQPLLVAPGDPDIFAEEAAGAEFALIDGERRWTAAKTLVIAGQWEADTPVPCLVRAPVDAEEHFELALTTSIQREDLSPLEEATAFSRLIDEWGWTTARIAEAMGKTDRWVQQRLALLKLGPAARGGLHNGTIGPAAARHIARLEPEEQDEIMEAIVKGHLIPHESRVQTRVQAIESRRRQADQAAEAEESQPPDAAPNAEPPHPEPDEGRGAETAPTPSLREGEADAAIQAVPSYEAARNELVLRAAAGVIEDPGEAGKYPDYPHVVEIAFRTPSEADAFVDAHHAMWPPEED